MPTFLGHLENILKRLAIPLPDSQVPVGITRLKSRPADPVLLQFEQLLREYLAP